MTSGSWILINLLGGIALLLWGVRMVRTGVMRAWGDRVQNFIGDALANRMTAFGVGTLATMLLQSSTATTLIVSSLAASGVITGAGGLAILLGADLGSALIATAIAASGPVFMATWPVFLFSGYLVFSVAPNFRVHNIGRILMGLGMMLLALFLIVSASEPMRASELFQIILTRIGDDPVIALLLGAIFTWLSHSSLASVLLVTSLVLGGVLVPEAAFALVLGINTGAGLPAVSATARQGNHARRFPLANIICRGSLAFILLPFLGPITDLAASLAPVLLWQVIGFHVGFNLLLAIICLPLSGIIMRTIMRMLPNPIDGNMTFEKPRYLDHEALETPSTAIANAQNESLRMAEVLARMLEISTDALITGRMDQLDSIEQFDERLNHFHKSIHAYLAVVGEHELEETEQRQLADIMHFVSNLEHAGDIIHLSLAERARSKLRQSIVFDTDQSSSLNHLSATVQASLKLAAGVLASNDTQAAKRLVEQKVVFRSHEKTIIDEHFRKSSSFKRGVAGTTALYVDLIRDMHRINSHVVSAAYPVLEAAGLLRESRIRGKPKHAS